MHHRIKMMYCNVVVCLLIIFIFSDVTLTCPSSCSCPNNNVVCINVGLTEIPKNLPNESSNIYLYQNQITSIPQGAFNGQPSLLRLHLFSNQIMDLQHGLFQGLAALGELWLDHNRLTTLQYGMFQGLPSLWSLYLYNNEIITVESRTFEDLPALFRLRLHNNRITTIQQGTLQGLPLLAYIKLNNNNITTLQQGTFAQLPALYELNFEENNLTSIQADTFQNNTNLKKLFLDLVCGCNVPFWSWMKSKSFENEKVTCLDRNVQLSSLQASDFNNCYDVPTTFVEPRRYTATEGDVSFNIKCTVVAEAAVNSWYWTFQPLGGSNQTIAQESNNQQYTVDNSSTNPDLTIKNISLNEAGVYTCYATNAAGTSQSDPNSRHTLTVTGGKEEEEIIIYVVIGIIAVLFLLVLLIVIVCYTKGREKRKVNARLY